MRRSGRSGRPAGGCLSRGERIASRSRSGWGVPSRCAWLGGRVEQLRDVQIRNGDANRQVWLLEFGWTSDKVHPAYSWFAVSEDQKAQNILEAFQYARTNWTPWVGVMTLWTMADPSWSTDREEYWWAITNSDGSARAAYNTVKTARVGGSLG